MINRFFSFAFPFFVVFAVSGCGTGKNNGANPGSAFDFKNGDTSGPQNNMGKNTPASPEAFDDIDAADLVAKMRLGWNLGNTLDAADLNWLGPNPAVSRMETAWGNPETSQENINVLKNAGFNIIRIPVSWSKTTDENFNIREDWMERVTEVVNYAYINDMFIILNTHHDEDIFKFTNADTPDSLVKFRKIWEQIAYNFRNYDERLIFEALNEPRTKGSSAEWNGGTPDERSNLNTHYQVFVDAVRASGGNNGKRFLMVNSYAASGELSALNGLSLPEDSAQNKIIVSYHAYSPYNFALNTDKQYNRWSINSIQDKNAITAAMDRAYSNFTSKGIPVVIGEFGAMHKNNIEARSDWAEFYTSYAKSKNMPCVWWDNGGFSGDGELFGLLNRRTNLFAFPEIVAALLKGTE